MFRTQLLRTLVPAARGYGVAVEPLLERAGLPADAEHAEDVALPVGALIELIDELATATRDPWFGLHAAMQTPRGAYGLLEFSCRSAPTLRGAIERMVRYYALLNQWETIAFIESHGEAVIEHRNPHVPAGAGRHGNDFFVALMVAKGREMTGAPFVPRRAWFMHSAPADLDELYAVLGTRSLAFDRPANGIALADADLARPLVDADAELLAVLDRAAAHQLAAARHDSTSADVARFVYRALRDHEPIELADACAALATHPRKLQRSLADDGTSYGDVVDAVRLDLARIFLLEKRGSLETLAFELGYSELRAFLRAFERWTGGPPSEFRR